MEPLRQLSAFLMALGAHGAILIVEVGGGSLAPRADARQQSVIAAAEFIEVDHAALLSGHEFGGDRMPDAAAAHRVEKEASPAPALVRPIPKKKLRPERKSPASNEVPVAAPAQDGIQEERAAKTEALDLTSFRIAAPTAPTAARSARDGSTASAEAGGGSAHGEAFGASHGTGRGQRGLGGSHAAGNLSAQLAIANRRWRCPWPTDADRLAIHQESATLRVCVSKEGKLESAEIRQDPGYGFGAAALGCVETARFTPARDRSGAAMDACATIRVRFER